MEGVFFKVNPVHTPEIISSMNVCVFILKQQRQRKCNYQQELFLFKKKNRNNNVTNPAWNLTKWDKFIQFSLCK